MNLKQKSIGIITLIFGIFSLIICIAFYYFNLGGREIPYETNIILIYFVASIFAIIFGLLIILTKKENRFSYAGSWIILVSLVFFMGFIMDFGAVNNGKYSLVGAKNAQFTMIIGLIAFIIGVIIFFIGKIKKE